MGLELQYPEGASPLDPNEGQGLIPSLATQAELNEFEALNILEGAVWSRKSMKVKRSLLDQRILREIHKRMFGRTWRWAGSYRLTQKSIGCEAYRIPSELKMLIDDTRCWVELGTYPPEEIAARFHHRLVWIHPFPNGNGRFARLITELLCEQSEWRLPTWGFCDLTAGAARHAYIRALRAADDHNLHPLVAFMFS